LVNNVSRQWLDTIANVRIHGETGRKQVVMFAEEKASVLLLAPQPYESRGIDF
jgi:hypothetical protein